MPACAAINCRNKSVRGSGRTFHRFPFHNQHASVLQHWIANVRRANWAPIKGRSVLCSEHFEDRCFDRTGQNTRLREGAVPTKFNFPSDSKAKAYNRIKVLKGRKKVLSDEAPPPDVAKECMLTFGFSSIVSGQEPRTLSTQSELTGDTNPTTIMDCRSRKSSCPTSIQQDHAYHTEDDPKMLKQKLDKALEGLYSMKKRLKMTQQKTRRLTKRMESMKVVMKRLQEEKRKASENDVNMLSEIMTILKGD